MWIAICAMLTGCGASVPKPEVTRIAIVAPQNLSGNSAFEGRAQSLQWALTVPFAGLSDVLVANVASRRQASDLRPFYIVEPVIEARGSVLQVLDASRHRHIAEIICSGDACVTELAQVLGITPRALRVPDEAGLRLWSLRRQPSEEGYRSLIQAYPDLSLIYEEWIRYLAQAGRTDEARSEMRRIRQRSWLPLEEAQFTLLQASLDGDTTARPDGLAALARSWPANAALQIQAAEALMQQRDFAGAVTFLNAARRAEPGNLPVLASLTYALSLSGDSAAALNIAAEAERLSSGSAFSFDLRGDALFLKGDFAEAEKAYLQTGEKGADYQFGRSFAKAAEAALFLNDVQRADQHMQRFFALYQKAVPGGIAIVQGLWLWRLGEREKALRQAEAFPSVTPLFQFLGNPAGGGPQPASAALQALAAGRAAEAADALKQIIRMLPPLQSSRWEQVLAVAHWEAGNKKEACAQLTNWGLPTPPDEWAGAVVWPRQLEVRASCLQEEQPGRAALLRKLVENVTRR